MGEILNSFLHFFCDMVPILGFIFLFNILSSEVENSQHEYFFSSKPKAGWGKKSIPENPKAKVTICVSLAPVQILHLNYTQWQHIFSTFQIFFLCAFIYVFIFRRISNGTDYREAKLQCFSENAVLFPHSFLRPIAIMRQEAELNLF